MRLADCDTLKSTFELWLRVGVDYNEAERNMLKAVIHEVKTAPTVDAVPVKHGYWRKIREVPDWDQRQCSECGDNFCCQLNYCPNCGAKMDGEKANE